jgi:hypothetical protein
MGGQIRAAAYISAASPLQSSTINVPLVPYQRGRNSRKEGTPARRNCADHRPRLRSKTKTQHDVHAHRSFSPSYLQRAKEDVTLTLLPSFGGGEETRWQPSQLSIAGAYKM